MASRSRKPLSCPDVSSIWSFKAVRVFALGALLAACGFTPIYKFDADAPQLQLASLSVKGDAIARGLRRSLEGRLELVDEAVLHVDIDLSRSAREVQKTASGVALRLELRHQARVQITQEGATTSQVFALTQFMTRGDSGADELSQLRALDDLAVRDLSGQITDYLSTQMRDGATQ